MTLSDLVRRSVGRARTWTVAHAAVERERTRELARIGANLNQIARWANTFKANAEAVEIVAHLVAIERALTALADIGLPDPPVKRRIEYATAVTRDRRSGVESGGGGVDVAVSPWIDEVRPVAANPSRWTAKDGFPDVGFYEVLPVELGVAEVGVGVSVRELQAGDPPGQVCGQSGEIGEIKNQLGYA